MIDLVFLFLYIQSIRYDVRGPCEDLTQFEAQLGGYGTRLDYLTPAEQRAEMLCEEERYYSLLKNEVEEEMYRGKGKHFEVPLYECLLIIIFIFP